MVTEKKDVGSCYQRLLSGNPNDSKVVCCLSQHASSHSSRT
ncbi:hypothetical protein CAter282_3787 [Collimonas arenae]|uniref:Uncharacterized protein n=1 Tax=Collimonas arenae TaxID=279058 RepID=A0A127QNR3_9BURK|nr:hypothetical protein CAter10_4133 [Collimonas arenae]AMP11465.1 hypothetical protein CAter282_3787 [Collimonas arenae]